MVHDYNIPEWVSGDTLVLVISYSGTTEETLSSAKFAIKKGASVTGITTGGELEKILREKNLPVAIINASDNPCGQPRFGVGQMMFAMLKVLSAKNLLTINESEMELALSEVDSWQADLKKDNGFLKLYGAANEMKNKMPVFVLAEHLAGTGRFIRNQFHETAKTFGSCYDIPELNHHLMESLSYPEENKKIIEFVFFESDLCSDKTKKRIAVTKDVLSKQGIGSRSFHIGGATKLGQSLIAMMHGMYLAFSLALIHEKDPSEIPWVNYFKEQLKK